MRRSKTAPVQTICIGIVERKRQPGRFRVAWVFDGDGPCPHGASFVVRVPIVDHGSGPMPETATLADYLALAEFFPAPA